MFNKKVVCFALAVACFVLGSGDMFVLQSHAATIPGCSGVTPPTIAVQNGSLMENGQPFILRGLQIRGFVAALQVDSDNATVAGSGSAWAKDATAQGAYGDAELNAASSWGANVIRIQVSQPSLDPQNTENDLLGAGHPLYSASYNYLQTVIDAVNKARCHGMVVILSMQDESLSGENNHSDLPTAATERAWQGLINAFGTSSDVMFEIYNEPTLTDAGYNWSTCSVGTPTTMNWRSWAHAGETTYDNNYGNPNGWVGMQNMLNYMRTNGATSNVLIMDGIKLAAELDGIPGLVNPPVDSNNNAAYAVHPYLNGCPHTQFDSEFRTVSPLAYPVIGTEWSAGAYDNPNGGIGLEGQPYDEAVQALNYFAQYNLHFVAGAFDIPGIMVQDITSWTPTNYDNYTTEESNPDTLDNAGKLVQKLFQNNYNITLTDADAL